MTRSAQSNSLQTRCELIAANRATVTAKRPDPSKGAAQKGPTMTSGTEQKIRKTIADYFEALNASDPQQAASVYSSNGVFMGDNSPTAIGNEITSAYEGVFSAVSLKLAYEVDEVSVHGNTAIARTHSTGNTTTLHNGTNFASPGRELFVLIQEAGAWKVHSFMFNNAGS